jgi:Holliday junction resolvasome RuvABC ATP-dependent DNA helicase subunit
MTFTGSQGLGKTYMAKKISEVLEREFIEINCGAITTFKDFVEKILIEKVLGENNKTILFDESHKLSSEITTLLLSLLNPNDKKTNHIDYKECSVEYDLSKVNVIFATTDLHKMFRPLVNRCEEMHFKMYSNEELFNILSFYSNKIKITCDKDDIAYACRGRARDAFLLSNNIIRYCNRHSINEFNEDCWQEIKNIFGFYDYGLKSEEIALMKLIKEASYISSANLAVKMGVNIHNIESEIELRPREIGFIENGTRGRCLTNKGREYIDSL